MKFVLRSDQPARFRSQFPEIDVRISQLMDGLAAGHAYLWLILTSLHGATKWSISGKHLFRLLVSIE